MVTGMGTAAGVSTASEGLGMFIPVEAMEEKEDMAGAWGSVVGDILIGALEEEGVLWEIFTVVVACTEEDQAEVHVVDILALPLASKGLDGTLDMLASAEASRKSASTPAC